MKLLSFLIISGATALLAQQPAPQPGHTGDRIVVPLSNPGQPATIKLAMITGSVTVTGGSGKDVVVEMRGGESVRVRDRRRDNATPPPGMHRIDMGSREEIVEDHNVVTIRPGFPGRNEHIAIEVPAAASLEIRAVSCGKIDVSGISGDVEVECTNGSLELKNISGSVVAHTINGSITAQMDRVATDKPMSFTSFNGKVDVTLPGDTKARLRLKSNSGEVYTDFDVKLDSGSTSAIQSGRQDAGRGKGGKYRISMDRSVTGTINGGGPEYLFQTMNGDIFIHRK